MWLKRQFKPLNSLKTSLHGELWSVHCDSVWATGCTLYVISLVSYGLSCMLPSCVSYGLFSVCFPHMWAVHCKSYYPPLWAMGCPLRLCCLSCVSYGMYIVCYLTCELWAVHQVTSLVSYGMSSVCYPSHVSYGMSSVCYPSHVSCGLSCVCYPSHVICPACYLTCELWAVLCMLPLKCELWIVLCMLDITDRGLQDRTYINSVGPSDAIRRWRSWSTLVQVMACCLTAPSHYLNQCWLIISNVL